MNWQLINIIGYISIVLLSIIVAVIVAVLVLIAATMINDKRCETRDMQRAQEPITQVYPQVRITVPRRQDVPDAFYKAFEEEK